MPRLRTYQVFISHGWERSDDYQAVVDLLNAEPGFSWHNLSLPEHNPLAPESLQHALRDQMRDADVFLMITGMYAVYSDWIDIQLALARRTGQPVIGIKKDGEEPLPLGIQLAASGIVACEGSSIVQAIRRFASASG